MAKKPYSSRLDPMGDVVLVRKPPLSRTLVIPGSKAAQGSSRAIVVAVGPGRQKPDGEYIPINPKIKPGVTTLAPADHYLIFSDIKQFEEDGLCFLPEESIVFIEAPE